MQLNAQGFVSFEYAQRIFTHGAKDFEYFFFRNNHYLVVANQVSQLITYNTESGRKNVTITNDYEVDSIIYWWSGKFFVEWQRVPTNGAVKWSSFAGPNGAILLVVANARGQAVIYTYDTRKGLFKPTNVQGLHPFPGNTTIPDVRAVEAFHDGNDTYLAVANFKQSMRTGYNIFKVKFALIPTEKSPPSLVQALSIPLNVIQKKLEELRKRLQRVQRTLDNMMTVDGNETVRGTKRFETKLKINKLRAKNLIYTGHVGRNPVEMAVRQAMVLERNLTEHARLIATLQQRLKDAVTKSGQQSVTGKKTFSESVEFSDVSVGEARVALVDGVNISDLQMRAWSKTNPQKMFGNYNFTQNVSMLKDLNVAGNLAYLGPLATKSQFEFDWLVEPTQLSACALKCHIYIFINLLFLFSGAVNGLFIPVDVMTTNTHQKVTGKKAFENDFTIHGNVTTSNFTINKLNIPDDVALRSRRQQIMGAKSFQSSIILARSLKVDGTVNGEKLFELSKRIVTLSTDQTIAGEKRFAAGFQVHSNLSVSGLVDGVSLADLIQDSVRLDRKDNIKGKSIIRYYTLVISYSKPLFLTHIHVSCVCFIIR